MPNESLNTGHLEIPKTVAGPPVWIKLLDFSLSSIRWRRGLGNWSLVIRSRLSRLLPPSSCLLLLLLLGCHSAPPPAPTPPAVSMAQRAQAQAAGLSQQQNWPAALRAWQLAADRCSLLNDLANEAVALHNLAQAERELGQTAEARKNLERAALLNEKTGRTNEWWRNQIGLLQLEAEAAQMEALKARFEKLLPIASQLREPSTHGMFLVEAGLWQRSQGEFNKAAQSFAEAERDFKTAHDTAGLTAISANRAELSELRKDYAAAINFWKTALAQFQSMADPQGIARALAGQGRALLAANQELALAEDLLGRAAHNYRTLNMTKQARATLELLAQCLQAEGKQEDAEAILKAIREFDSGKMRMKPVECLDKG